MVLSGFWLACPCQGIIETKIQDQTALFSGACRATVSRGSVEVIGQHGLVYCIHHTSQEVPEEVQKALGAMRCHGE